MPRSSIEIKFDGEGEVQRGRPTIKGPVKLSATDAALIFHAIHKSYLLLWDKNWMKDVLMNSSEEYR